MTNEHRYILASNKVPKPDCPYCGAKKHWQRYIDKKTGKVLPDLYGRCDNEEKCGRWNDPYKMGYEKTIREQEQEISVKSVKSVKGVKVRAAYPLGEPLYFFWAFAILRLVG